MSLIQQAEGLQIRIAEAPGELDQFARVIERPRNVIGHKEQTAYLHPQQQACLVTLRLSLKQLCRPGEPASHYGIVISLIMLPGQRESHTSSTSPVAIALIAGLGPLQRLEHLVVAPCPTRGLGQALKIRGRSRPLFVGCAQQLVGALPLSSQECLPAKG